jgi:phage shock protein A
MAQSATWRQRRREKKLGGAWVSGFGARFAFKGPNAPRSALAKQDRDITAMSVFSRLTDIVQANINARAEDPEKLIRLIIQEMEDTLVEVRSSAVRIIADKKELERKRAELAQTQEDWERKAETALRHGREDLARGALAEKAKLAKRLADDAAHLQAVEESLAKTKLDDAKSREAALTARHQSAQARVKLRATLHDPRVEGAFARFEQVERNLDELEGKAEAYDIGRGTGGPGGPRKTLADEIADLETETAVNDDLARLKARLAARDGG